MKNLLYNKADEVLAHYGVLGMKWGVRRGSRSKSTGGLSDKRKDQVAKAQAKLQDSQARGTAAQTRAQAKLAKSKAKIAIAKEKQDVNAAKEQLKVRQDQIKSQSKAGLKKQKKEQMKAEKAADRQRREEARLRYEQQKREQTKNSVKKQAPSLKSMSDEELRERLNRLTMEKRYKEMMPEQKSRGAKIADHILKQVIIPAATEMGKQQVKTMMGNALSGNGNGNNKKADTNNTTKKKDTSEKK